MPDSPKPLTYADAGVDIDAGNRLVDRIKPLARSTRRPGADAELGGFGGLFDLKAAGFVDPILVAANDGVGTKVKIAIESGIFDTIGIDLVAMCVNDIVVQGAEPLLFLDYFAAGKLDERVAAAVVKGIAAGCAESGCALIGGETAEMPGLYADGDFDLAGFAVGAAERGTLLPRGGLKAGDAVFGLPSSGVHSNGFSLVRRIVRVSGLDWDHPAPFEPSRSLAAALLDPDPALRAAAARGPEEGSRRPGARAHHRRRLSRQSAARAARRARGRARSRRLRAAPGVLVAGRRRKRVGSRDAAEPSTAASAWRFSSRPSRRTRRARRCPRPGSNRP